VDVREQTLLMLALTVLNILTGILSILWLDSDGAPVAPVCRVLSKVMTLFSSRVPHMCFTDMSDSELSAVNFQDTLNSFPQRAMTSNPPQT